MIFFIHSDFTYALNYYIKPMINAITNYEIALGYL